MTSEISCVYHNKDTHTHTHLHTLTHTHTHTYLSELIAGVLAATPVTTIDESPEKYSVP